MPILFLSDWSEDSDSSFLKKAVNDFIISLSLGSREFLVWFMELFDLWLIYISENFNSLPPSSYIWSSWAVILKELALIVLRFNSSSYYSNGESYGFAGIGFFYNEVILTLFLKSIISFSSDCSVFTWLFWVKPLSMWKGAYI